MGILDRYPQERELFGAASGIAKLQGAPKSGEDFPKKAAAI